MQMDKIPMLRISGVDGAHQDFLLHEASYTVGRDSGEYKHNHIAVKGDPLISRHHFDIHWNGSKLRVVRCAKARNPVFFGGEESDDFLLEPGQLFVTGKTRFVLQLSAQGGSRIPTTEFTHSRKSLQGSLRPNVQECFQALLEMLPELRTSTNEKSAYRAALKVLRELVPEASEFAILALGDEAVVLAQEFSRKSAVATPPSRRLLERAFELSSTVTHVWAKAASHQSGSIMMTEHARADWALVAPLEVAGGERFALYVVGSAREALTEAAALEQQEYLNGLASLCDIVAATLEHHLEVARFNQFEGQVVRFFSPALRKTLASQDFSEVLKPQKRKVTVLFFDLRGFSKATEKAQGGLDTILENHEALTSVMTAVTNCVFKEDGVVIDYQGDAVMACWGALCDDCQADKAVRAALSIVETVYDLDLPFGDGVRSQRCGIGLATGDVIAGQVGAQEQTKFGVLGPTVDLASRLEGLTKYFKVPIVINSGTRVELDKQIDCRRIGLVRPSGLKKPAELFELVVEKQLGGSGLSEDQIQNFEKATYLYEEGKMEESYQTLMLDSCSKDPIARFLLRHLIDHLDDGLPDNFDGVLDFRYK